LVFIGNRETGESRYRMIRKIVNSTTLSQRGKLILFFVHLYVFSGVIQIVSANECDTRVALVVSIQGVVDVRAQEDSTWRSVTLNEELCAGDHLRVGADSRAGLTLDDETLLRLNEQTIITINAPNKNGASLLELIKGVAHIISRITGTFQVSTPYVNAMIEGTEFSLSVGDVATDIVVFEGVVVAANSAGSIELAANQSGRAKKDQAPVRTILANPRDAVVWTLYIPPLPVQPDAAYELAKQAVIAIAQNHLDEAVDLARQSIAVNERSAAAYMAQSYVDQARYDIQAALTNSRKAAELAPHTALTHARLAEVWLMNAESRAAQMAAEKAISLDPQLSLAHLVMGFSSLREVDFGAAKAAFETAIKLDSSAPLPRFGLGLTLIRQGELAWGRREIETAVLLDPNSALLRSYLGKAYYEEKRNALAATQFALAKQLDNLDPTAWFYDAILKQAENRPVEALNDIQTSIDLNDNRAVYRSRLLLDQDEAARNASQARIYQDLGFERIARKEAYRSLQGSAQSHSAHRLLADSYREKPLYEKARLSELLQSQLFQPLNRTPIQPQLTTSSLGILNGAGPSAGGFSEYTPLFTRNGLGIQFNGVGGSNRTAGDDLILSGLQERVAFSLGQFHYENDGWRANSDIKQDIYDGFLQASLSSSTNIQFEYIHQKAASGDLAFRFDPADYFEYERNDLQRSLGRIGLHHQFSSGSHFIASAVYQDLRDRETESFSTYNSSDPDYGGYPSITDSFWQSTWHSISRSLELQYIQALNGYSIVIGGGKYDETKAWSSEEWELFTVVLPTPPNYEEPYNPSPQHEEVDPQFANLYLYSHFSLTGEIDLTLGAAYEEFKNIRIETDQWVPKIGLVWEPLSNLALRAVYLERIARPRQMERSIEPTQVAGFNQLIDDIEGSEIKQFGAGFDVKPNNRLRIGAEFSRRDLQAPLNFGAMYDGRDEQYTTAYLYWTATDRLSLHLSYEKEDYESTKVQPQSIVTKRTPIGFNYHWPIGIYLQAVGTYVDQKIAQFKAIEQEDFWNIDAVLGYRFPKGFGKIEIVSKNILDEEYRYYDLSFHSPDIQLPQFQPERQILVRFALDF
jgi:Flp pilus assembly protein TadD